MVKHAKAGDIIAVAAGAKVPLLLRSAGEHEHSGVIRKMYSIVGTAYVHGLMDGEAFRDKGQWETKSEPILLQ